MDTPERIAHVEYTKLQLKMIEIMKSNGKLPADNEQALDCFIKMGYARMLRAFVEQDIVEMRDCIKTMIEDLGIKWE